MNSLQFPKFSQLIQEISINSRYIEAVAKAQVLYLIKPLGLQTLNPSQVVQLINRNLDRSLGLKRLDQVQEDNLSQTAWALNEFKLCVWVSVCYGHLKKMEFQNFNEQEYAFLHSLFPRKSPIFLEYQLKSLMKVFKNSNEKWSIEQEALLIRIIKQENYTFKWIDISFKLFAQSKKSFFRSQQKCREKWFNHLDPDVNRRKWTLEEDLSLFSYINLYGTRWALISKMFKGSRTEHMVKNRFNSLRKKYQNKFNRTSSNKINEKIHADLFAKVHGAKFQLQEKIIKKQKNIEDKNEEIIQINNQAKIATSLLQNSHPRIYFFNEFYQESFIEWEEKPIKLRQLSQIDLEKMMFSESTLNIQQPFQATDQVELIEVEMFAHQPMNDEYISLLD